MTVFYRTALHPILIFLFIAFFLNVGFAANLENKTSCTAAMSSVDVNNYDYSTLAAEPMPGEYTPSPQSSWLTIDTPVLIETENTGNAVNPQVAADFRGNAITVWRQKDGARYNIWANRYTFGKGWETAELIETGEGDVDIPQVAVDTTGNAIAIWNQSDGIRNNIWANRYQPGKGWGIAQLIETDNAGHAYFPHVAFDASGNAVAVWNQSDGARYDIWANRYQAGKGWGAAELIEADDAGDAHRARVAVDPSGNAIAVWSQHNETLSNVWANRYQPGKGWGNAEMIESENAGDVYEPQVAVDTRGNAVAVWQQYSGTIGNIWANRYTVGTGWGNAQLIETDYTETAAGPQLGMDGEGNALAVWIQYDGSRNRVWGNRYIAGVGWGTAKLIEQDAGSAYLRMAVDYAGNAVVVGQIYTITRDVWAKSYTPGTGWGAAEFIEMDPRPAYGPNVAAGTMGSAIAVWEQDDCTRLSIWAGRLTYSDLKPSIYTPADETIFMPELQLGGNQLNADAAKAYTLRLSRRPEPGYVFELTSYRRIPITANPSATFDKASGIVDMPVVVIPGFINKFHVQLNKRADGYNFDLISAKKN